MSTSCVITLEKCTIAAVYCHWDGNPESKLPWLESFNKQFVIERGDDDPYKLAQLLRSSSADAEKYNLDPSKFTGWGLISNDDISETYVEYTYRLMKDGSVKTVQH